VIKHIIALFVITMLATPAAATGRGRAGQDA
jgi:hypothetical protein